MIAAIIVEYNPLHNGHIHHINSTRKILDKMHPTTKNHIIAIMSGGFCQRGEPAILNKYTRTKHALLSGVDMVIELPSIYATSAAEYFAKGAIEIISKIDNVGLVCFGSECGDMDKLNNVCDAMSKDKYNSIIKLNLDSGLSYPASSANALTELGVCDNDLLKLPNNTLAIEYIKQAKKFNLAATLATIKREGSGYHDDNYDVNNDENFASATAIRKSLTDNKLEEICKQVPKCVYSDLASAEIDYNKLLGVIATCALAANHVYEDNEGIINRIKRGILTVNSYDELIEYSHTKRYTKSKIKRVLIHLALSHFQIDTSRPIGLIKVLGVKEDSKSLLSLINHDGDSYHIDIDTYTNSIYNIVSTDKITMDKMLII